MIYTLYLYNMEANELFGYFKRLFCFVHLRQERRTKIKKLISIFFVLTVIWGMSIAVFGETDMGKVSEEKIIAEIDLTYCQTLPESFEVQRENGETVHININPDVLNDVNGKMVKEIIEGNHLEDGSAINIDNIGYGGQQEEMEQLSTDSEAYSNADIVQQSRISRIFFLCLRNCLRFFAWECFMITGLI